MSGFSHDLAGGNGNLVIASFQSPNFVHNVSGWQITQAGDAEFNQVQARGQFFLNGNNGSEIAILLFGGLPQIALVPPSVTQMTEAPTVFSNSINPGAANESMDLILVSGKSNGQADAGIQLFGQSADGTTAASVIFEFGGIIAVTCTSSGMSADSWHNVTTDAGWGSLGEPAQYRLLADSGFVALRGDISHAGTTAQTAINSGNPLPAAYRPAATRYYRPPQAADGAGAIQVDSSGVITMRASGFTATQAILDGIYSLA